MKSAKSARINSKKGIIFTIDALIALALSVIFLFAILYYFSHSVSYSSNDLRVFAQDSLAVLEKSGALSSSDTDTSDITTYINATPQQICINISVFNPAETAFIKPGCSMAGLEDVSVATRVFVNNFNARYAKTMAWYDE